VARQILFLLESGLVALGTEADSPEHDWFPDPTPKPTHQKRATAMVKGGVG
jgi:hypothetical protein